MNAQFRTWLIVVLMLLVTGCTTPTKMYSGEILPRKQISVIQYQTVHYYIFYAETLVVSRIDGIPTNITGLEIEVLPGEHTLELALNVTLPLLAAPATAARKPFATTPHRLSFIAEAGHEYKIDGKRVDTSAQYDMWSIWVEDVQSGEIVGGIRPDSK